MITKYTVRSLIVFTLIAMLMSSVIAQSPVDDLLLYLDASREPAVVIAYNPTTGEEIQLLLRTSIEYIRTSGDGRIAYAQDNDVWILDVLNDPQNPTQLTQTPNEEKWVIGWTPDARLLEFIVGSVFEPSILYTYDGTDIIAVDSGYNLSRYWNENGWYVAPDENNISNPLSWYVRNEQGWHFASDEGNMNNPLSWHVWDGQERIDLDLSLLPAEPTFQRFEWTPNNRLFITIGYDEQEYGQPIGSTAIFYWDGNIIQEVTRPSQDETFLLGEWSFDGRLTFYTIGNDYIERWYIWDGISFTPDGVPDMSALTAINSPTERVRDVDWMPDGRLAIVARGDPESDTLLGHPFSCSDPCAIQVYIWDDQTLIQITANDYGSFLVNVQDNSIITVSDFDGLRINGFTIFDTDFDPIFQSRDSHSFSSWSADGNLAFCGRGALSVWNGQDTIELSSGIYSKWLLSPSLAMNCSTG